MCRYNLKKRHLMRNRFCEHFMTDKNNCECCKNCNNLLVFANIILIRIPKNKCKIDLTMTKSCLNIICTQIYNYQWLSCIHSWLFWKLIFGLLNGFSENKKNVRNYTYIKIITPNHNSILLVSLALKEI